METITKIVVIGSTGQLGTDLMKVFGNSAIGLTHKEIDVCKPNTFDVIKKIRPDVIINTAAYVDVKLAEIEVENAFRVNAIGALNIAKLCSEINAINVYISTDYVFDGEKKGPYTEKDNPAPINVYGASKYAGEIFTKIYSKKYYILRIASLFGLAGSSGKGGNFIEGIIKKIKTGEIISVVNDITTSPTYTKNVAENFKFFLSKKPSSGVYHFANTGKCTWHELSEEIFKLLNLSYKLKKISSANYDSDLKRPKNSSLKNKKLGSLGIILPNWKCAVKAYLKERGYIR